MELKGITCKIPLDLHNQISEEIRETESTMSRFIEMVIREHYEKGANKVMEKGRTLAFQVSEELFQRVKEYLDWYEKTYHRRLTQKEFVIGLIEEALEEAEEEFEAARATEPEEQVESPWRPTVSEETDENGELEAEGTEDIEEGSEASGFTEEENGEESDEEVPCEPTTEDTPQEDELEPDGLTDQNETTPDNTEEPQSPIEEDEEAYA